MAILRRLILRDHKAAQRGPPERGPTNPSNYPLHPPTTPHPRESSVAHLPVETGPLVQLDGCRVAAVLDLDHVARLALRHSWRIRMDRLRRALIARASECHCFGLCTSHRPLPQLVGLNDWTVIVDRGRQATRFRDWRMSIAMHTLYLAACVHPEILLIGTSDWELRRIVTVAMHAHRRECGVFSISVPHADRPNAERCIPPRDRWHISMGRDVVVPV